MNRNWNQGRWLLLGLLTAALAGCAPTAEREGPDSSQAAVATSATEASAVTQNAVARAGGARIASTELGTDGYDLRRPRTALLDDPAATASMAAITPIAPMAPVDNYINSRYKDRGLGVRASRPPVEPKVDADAPDKYELKAPERDSDQQGQASWYGEQFHGRRTASGERFDLNELTAAHKTLPFGTKVCVRSSVTGKTVVVRINDRGPFAPGRVIDLSKAAAQELGMLGLGIKPVEIWRLGKNEGDCPDMMTAAGRKRQASTTAAASVPAKAVAARAKVRPAPARTQHASAKTKPRK